MPLIFQHLRRPRGWLLLGLLAFFGAFLVYPVAFMFRRAFGQEGEFTFRYFTLLLENPFVRRSIVGSFALATLTTVLTSLVAVPLAQALTRWRFAGRQVLSTALLVPMILPPFVGGIGLKQVLARYGSLNLTLMDLGWMDRAHPVDWLGEGGFWGIVLLQVLSLYPILFLNVSAAMANVDPSLGEAAGILGASAWRRFRTVTLPLILPGWFAGASVVWIWSFTDLGTPLIFGYSRLVAVQIWDATNDLNTNPQGYTLALFVLLLTVTLYLVSRRGMAGRRVEMMSRGHSGSAETPARPWQAALVWLGAGSLLAVALLPHLGILAQSLAGRWFLSVLPDSWTGQHFGEVFGHGLTGSSIRNSLAYSATSAFVDVVLGAGIAWLLTRCRIPFAGLLDALAMLPLALPGLVLAFGLYAGFNIAEKDHPGLDSWLDPRTNPTFLLVVSYSVRRLPYIVRAATAGLQQTHVVLEEASASLGAGPWTTLRRVTVPLVAANLVAGGILTFAFAMLEVSDSLILAQRDRFFPMTKMIWQLMGRIDPSAPSVASALGIVGMGILLASLALAGKLMGRSLGQLFRA